MSILIVEDSRYDRDQVQFLLNLGGHFDLVYAETVKDAYTLLGMEDPNKKNVSFDLIIIDTLMPGINGINVIEKIKAKSHLKDIPIVVVTADINIESMLAAFEIGIMDYISKPLDNKIELLARVNSALTLKREMDIRKDREKELLKMTKLLEESNKKLQLIASADGLTGIANRRYFNDTSEREWRSCLRSEKPLSILMIDIDHFKLYNDTYGHQKGDECLKTVAQLLSDAVQRPKDLVARYGGEEFILMLCETPIEGAIIIAEKLIEGCEALNIIHESSLTSEHVTFSMGVASVIPKNSSSLDKLIEAADNALYQAKDSGRNQFVVFRSY